jgi:hypothetical protein
MVPSAMPGPTKIRVLDQDFIPARHKLLDVAAFLDRLDCAQGEGDFRLDALRRALAELPAGGPDRTRRILELLSDPTAEPVPAAGTKGAAGAWPGPPRASPPGP